MTTPATSFSGRPRIHFTPAANWMNDPNGLIYHRGIYHLFFQHNPLAAEWGNMSWGHATSTDLKQWREQPLALRFDDEEEVFSGSVVLDAANESGLGTEGEPPLVALYTSATLSGQAQALAYSRDGSYVWTKHGTVLDRGTTDFRDPKVIRHQGRWIMVAVEAVDRQLHFFASSNLLEWEPLSVFGPYGAPEGLWECPDLFPIGDRWVLTLSVNPGHPAGGSGMQYIVGDFDGTTFTPTRWDWLDHGHDYYAGVTFSGLAEPTMLAWLSNWAYARDVPAAPWRGATALPRRIGLRGETLTQHPAISVEGQPVYEVSDLLLADEQLDIPVSSHDAVVRVQARIRVGNGPIELRVRGSAEEERIRIGYAEGALSVDRSAAWLPALSARLGVVTAPVSLTNGVLDIDVWIDTASVEVFADGGAVSISEQLLADAGPSSLCLVAVGSGHQVEHLEVHCLGGTTEDSSGV